MRPKLTIGMATHDDFHGVYFTVQSLRLALGVDARDVELVVVDQSPDSEHGRLVRRCVEGSFGRGLARARYVPFTDTLGSAPAKQRVFDEAEGETVLLLDCHVLLRPGAAAALLAAPPGPGEMLQAPILWDDLAGGATHLRDVWRGNQWGTWGDAWRCACGRYLDPDLDTGRLLFRCPRTGGLLGGACPSCGAAVLPRPGADLWQSMREAGFGRVLDRPDRQPRFEIGAQGTFFIFCRKADWPGFPPGMAGFGAEEWVIQERFRRAGGRVLCDPALATLHRFPRPEGPRYPLRQWQRVRNYVLGFRSIGRSLRPVWDHFVSLDTHGLPLVQHLVEEHSIGQDQLAGKSFTELEALHRSLKVSPAEWTSIRRGATEEPAVVQSSGCGGCGSINVPPSLEDWYQLAWRTPSDINEHCSRLRELAAQCDVVVEFGMRHGVSTVALLVGGPRKLYSYDVRRGPEAAALEQLGGGRFEFRGGDSLTADIPSCDLLFIDTRHTEAHLSAELTRHAGKVRRWIALHDTVIYGEVGEDGGPGLLSAVVKFLEAHPEWTVKSHDPNNHGLLVLTRDQADKEAVPDVATRAWNFFRAVARRGIDGFGNLDPEKVQKRLRECTLCPHRNGTRCAKCGCPVAAKASWPTERCPDDPPRWGRET